MLIYNSSGGGRTAAGRCLFLDRDGVINEEVDYLYRIEDCRFMPGIFELCRTAAANGFLLIVITNQAGIARGYYNEEDLRKLTEWMVAEFSRRGIEIARVYACPHLPTAAREAYRCDCPARKPNPGMLLRAQADFNLDPAECVFIGDRYSDMEAGLRAGVGRLFLLNAEPEAVPEKSSVPGSGVMPVASL
ncbi:MAG: HAD family hydrolase, partial [Victivallales bacterium]|nr:HAD family hydrolase [Victivallales bacterium]